MLTDKAISTKRNLDDAESTYSMDSSANRESIFFSVSNLLQAISIGARVLVGRLLGDKEFGCSFLFHILHI